MTIKDVFDGRTIVVTTEGISECKKFLKKSKVSYLTKWIESIESSAYRSEQKYYHCFIKNGELAEICCSPQYDELGCKGYTRIRYGDVEDLGINITAWQKLME